MPTPIPATAPVLGLLAPKNYEDAFPVYDFRYGLGGFRTVGVTLDLSIPSDAGEAVNPATPDRSITSARRRKGMMVYVEGVTAYYGLFSSTADSAWEIVGPKYFKGGIRSLGSTGEMEAIRGEMREEGMIVYVSGVTAYYALIGTTANSGWTTGFTFGKGGGAGDVTAAGANIFTNLNTFNAGITTSFIYASTGSTFGGTLRVNGGATLAGRVDIGGVLDVVGGVTFESTSDHAGIARFAAGITTSAIDVTGLAKFNGNIVLGDASADTITSTGTFQGITVSTGAALFNAGVTASTIDASGVARFASGVTVSGRLDAAGILDVGGGATFESTTDHAGVARFAAGITTSTIDVTGLAKFNGNMTFGDAATDTITSTGTFQGITVSNGAALFNAGVTASTLDVTGAARLASTLAVTGILTQTGGATFANTTDHTGAARFASTLTATGVVTANGGLTASAIDVTGLAKFNGNVTVGDAASDVLTVVSGATFGITDHSNVARFAAGITTSAIDVTGLAKFNGNMTFGDAAADTITANGTFQGITVSTGAALFNAGITASTIDASGAARFASTVTTTGILTANGGITASTVDVTGLAKFNGNVTVGDAASDVLTVASGATFGITDHSGAARFDNTVTIKGSAANTTFDTVGNVTVGATLTVNGNFFVAGTVTTVNRTDLQVDDKTILLGRTLANDTQADGGGILLSSGLTASITWSNTNKAWTTNQGWDIVGNTYAYKVAGATALAATYLGSVITGSSLASVGTITSGRWRGSILELAYGGASADLSGETTNGIVYKAANNLAVSGAGTNTKVLSADGSGVPTWINMTALTGLTADSVKIQDRNATSGTVYLTFTTDAGNAMSLFIDKSSGVTYDASTNILSCTKIEAIVDGGVWT